MPKPRVLFFDIETSPNLAYVWGKYDQNVISFKQEWEILSFAWKWQGDARIECLSRSGYKDDRWLCGQLHRVLAKADVVVAHNGDAFDLRKARARFVVHGLEPLPPIPSVDTKKVAKSRFNFNSNSLDDLGRTLGIGRKKATGGFDLWLKCMAGDKKAWKLMEQYNKQDVILLEKIYDRLKPWMLNHPSLAALNPGPGCPKCGSKTVQKRGFMMTPLKKKQQWQCTSCRGWWCTALGAK